MQQSIELLGGRKMLQGFFTEDFSGHCDSHPASPRGEVDLREGSTPFRRRAYFENVSEPTCYLKNYTCPTDNYGIEFVLHGGGFFRGTEASSECPLEKSRGRDKNETGGGASGHQCSSEGPAMFRSFIFFHRTLRLTPRITAACCFFPLASARAW